MTPRSLANHANSQLSTGPVTPEGKAISSKNALKTGLTGRTILLPTDDAERYANHLAGYEKAYRPVGERELEVTQALADTAWRLDRIPGLEEALYYKGSLEFTVEVDQHQESARPAMLRLHTYLTYERQFKNLHLQERRLQSQRGRLIAELKELQAERKEQEAEALAAAANLYRTAKTENQPFDGPRHGFEFSTDEIEKYLATDRTILADQKDGNE